MTDDKTFRRIVQQAARLAELLEKTGNFLANANDIIEDELGDIDGDCTDSKQLVEHGRLFIANLEPEIRDELEKRQKYKDKIANKLSKESWS